MTVINPGSDGSASSGWAPYLDTGEKVLWSCAPPGRMPLHPYHLLSVPVGLIIFLGGLAMAFSLVGTAEGNKPPDPFLSAIFTANGAWLSFGVILRGQLRRSNSLYALTNRRALILYRLWGKKLREMRVADMTEVEVVFGRRGTIWLGPRPSEFGNPTAFFLGSEPSRFAFARIPEAEEVHKLIRKIQQGGV